MRGPLAALVLVACLLLQGSGTAARHAAPARHVLPAAWVTGYLWTGQRTATGIWPRWGVVAVDPRVIPLGSHLTISGMRGVFTAADTGGAVIGAHVDVFCWSLARAYSVTGWHAVTWWR